jgi:mRNA interferase RelE/StbE
VASYSLRIKRSAAKELEAVPLKDRRRIVTRIEGLRTEPRPPGCEKLSGDDKYRIRQGNYRILYQIQDHALIVTVVRLGERRDVNR